MGRLSGLVFILVGAVVAIFSFVLMQRGQKMQLFLIAGLAMAVFGAWRLFVDKSSPPSEGRMRGRDVRNMSREQLQRELDAEFSQKRSLSNLPRVCARCGTKNHPQAKFCGNCGQQL